MIDSPYVLNPWRSLLGRHGAAGLSCGAREIAAGMRPAAEALSLSHGMFFSTGTSWGIFGYFWAIK